MISVAELRAWLKAPEADDPILEQLEAAAVAFVERQTSRYFGPVQETTETLDGSGRVVLWLSEPPTKVEAVTLTLSTIAIGDSTQELGPDDYEVEGRKLVRKHGIWPKGERAVRVHYTRGYAPGEEPADIRQVVIDLVAARYRQRGSEGIASKKVGDLAITFTAADAARVPGVAATLAAWRSAYRG